jgi:hypothetical protein
MHVRHDATTTAYTCLAESIQYRTTLIRATNFILGGTGEKESERSYILSEARNLIQEPHSPEDIPEALHEAEQRLAVARHYKVCVEGTSSDSIPRRSFS